ncbi:hypothetical protein [Bacillus thuringiensis]|uniref:Uncharacterized protein n=1 Tax=Bacillus thuringiensis subsp. higo TaxID=132266 RepID=A0A9X6M5V5_BACUH|nr:hypothetical protein [Bacillus thuringiensis]OUB62836.1 hypothetical protein BK716_00105 [Bacillus thuringiensis serovar higo]
MAKKKASILDFDNNDNTKSTINSNKEITNVSVIGSANNNQKDTENNNASIIANDSDIDNNSILSSVLSKTIKEPKKTYTGFYLEEPIIKTINKIVKENKDTNKSKLVNDLLREAFKQAGLL